LDKHTKSIVQGSLSFIQNVFAWTSQHDCAGFISLAAWKSDNFIFSNEDFLNRVTSSKNFLWPLRTVESGNDLCSQSSWYSLDSLEISVFDHHDTLLNE
jgi:hypothetical protein